MSAVLGFLGLLPIDVPKRDIPPNWESGLTAGGEGQFVIRRAGDVTLKFVTARLASGNLELVPVPYYAERGPATQSVREIARRFGLETRRSVIAAINGGFFDTKTGLPIGFLLRDGRMEFFNMPQGFIRTMVGFRAAGFSAGATRALISSPRDMPKVWLETLQVGEAQPIRSGRVAVHHINIPSGKHAIALYTPTYGKVLPMASGSIFISAREEPGRRGIYRVAGKAVDSSLRIPPDGLVIALFGEARAKVNVMNPGALIRPRWSLPQEWFASGITHGILAGPRLLEKGKIQVTAKAERLHTLKSRDRVALGLKANGDMLLVWAHKNTPGNLSFEQMAGMLAGMGAVEAIALDGGKSRAILAQSGEALASERYFEGGRPVANALILAQTLKSKV